VCITACGHVPHFSPSHPSPQPPSSAANAWRWRTARRVARATRVPLHSVCLNAWPERWICARAPYTLMLCFFLCCCTPFFPLSPPPSHPSNPPPALDVLWCRARWYQQKRNLQITGCGYAYTQRQSFVNPAVCKPAP